MLIHKLNQGFLNPTVNASKKLPKPKTKWSLLYMGTSIFPTKNPIARTIPKTAQNLGV